MAWKLSGTYAETCSCELMCPCNLGVYVDDGAPAGSDLTMAEARRSSISAFGIEYEGKTGLSSSRFSWAA